jgi:hypothetical protein
MTTMACGLIEICCTDHQILGEQTLVILGGYIVNHSKHDLLTKFIVIFEFLQDF